MSLDNMKTKLRVSLKSNTNKIVSDKGIRKVITGISSSDCFDYSKITSLFLEGSGKISVER